MNSPVHDVGHTRGTTMMQDMRGAPPDYAAEVGRLIASARHPVPIGGGLIAGTAAGYGMYRMQNPPGTKNKRFLMPVVSGAVGSILTHGALSWIHYKMGDDDVAGARTAMNDGGLVLTERATALSAQRAASMRMRSAALGASSDLVVATAVGGVGGVAAGYGIYRWRNPKGQHKKRWVLAVVGGFVGCNIVGGLTFAMLAARRTSMFASALGDRSVGQLPAVLGDGPLSFSTAAAALTSTGILVGVVGGAKYLYDSYGPDSYRRGKKKR